MPITNGKYVAPTWSNGGGVPISAANLQDMSDAIAFSGRIAVGSYTGTGTYGSKSKGNKMTFDFPPKAVIVQGYTLTRLGVMLSGNQTGSSIEVMGAQSDETAYGAILYTYWEGNSVTWFSHHADAQLNDSSITYRYIAIG